MGSSHWNAGNDMALSDEVFKKQEVGTGDVWIDQYEIPSYDSASESEEVIVFFYSTVSASFPLSFCGFLMVIGLYIW